MLSGLDPSALVFIDEHRRSLARIMLDEIKTVVTYKEGVSCIADHHVTWLPNMGCRMLPDRMELTADVRGKTGNCITVVKTF